MPHDVQIRRLAYAPDEEMVSVELTGDMGGRSVDLSLRFALRAHGLRPDTDLRPIALLEVQQILRSASTLVLPAAMVADTEGGRAPSALIGSDQDGTDRAPRREAEEIVWIGS